MKLYFSAEELLAHELINYLESGVQHRFGLCSFVQTRHGLPSDEQIDPYPHGVPAICEAVKVVSKEIPAAARLFKENVSMYIGGQTGRTAAREAYAKIMLEALETGRLRYSPAWGRWVGRAR